MSVERDALRDLAATLRSKIDGLPDHPWVPNIRFQDGELLVALNRAETVLGELSNDLIGDREEELRRRQLEVETGHPRSRGVQIGDSNTQMNHFN